MKTTKMVHLFSRFPEEKKQQVIDLIDRLLSSQLTTNSFKIGLQAIFESPPAIEIREPALAD